MHGNTPCFYEHRKLRAEPITYHHHLQGGAQWPSRPKPAKIEGFGLLFLDAKNMDKREQRWAKEDAARDSYRKQYMEDLSPDELAGLLEIWSQEDRRRIKHRVIARKGADLSRVPKAAKPKAPMPKAKPRKVNREREDERIEARYKKQDLVLVEKWKYEDAKRIAKRKAHEHLIYLKRCEQSAKLSERRHQEDECNLMAKEDLRVLGRVARLGSAPN